MKDRGFDLIGVKDYHYDNLNISYKTQDIYVDTTNRNDVWAARIWCSRNLDRSNFTPLYIDGQNRVRLYYTYGGQNDNHTR